MSKPGLVNSSFWPRATANDNLENPMSFVQHLQRGASDDENLSAALLAKHIATEAFDSFESYFWSVCDSTIQMNPQQDIFYCTIYKVISSIQYEKQWDITLNA